VLPRSCCLRAPRLTLDEGPARSHPRVLLRTRPGDPSALTTVPRRRGTRGHGVGLRRGLRLWALADSAGSSHDDRQSRASGRRRGNPGPGWRPRRLPGAGRQNRLKRLGPAFGTKFLYFCPQASAAPPALILDRLVAEWLAEHTHLHVDPVPWSLTTSTLYLEELGRWADALDVSPDVVEERVFLAMSVGLFRARVFTASAVRLVERRGTNGEWRHPRPPRPSTIAVSARSRSYPEGLASSWAASSRSSQVVDGPKSRG
jgi:hypothetical protein